MDHQKIILAELQSLHSALSKWCEFLIKNNYSNFAEIFQSSFNCLQSKFNTDNKIQYEALLDFQDAFKGGMGSINDISIDDSFLRQAVEKERNLLIDKYYALLFLKN